MAAALDAHVDRLTARTVSEALDHAAEQWADQPALVQTYGGGPTLTWRELRKEVTRVRSGLERLGVTTGDAVGILLHHQVELPITWLAVVEAGATAIPIDPHHTPREVACTLKETEARWIVAAADLVWETLREGAIGPIPVDRIIALGPPVAGTRHFTEATACDPDPRADRANYLYTEDI
ncbi:AMP-binding protein [Streptomyces sp. NPDC003247]|uniref:AMP-binding protein n=1 Tax=Streptomyces sp. NPDC003247 TaxID=3364677 RepID=UPI00368EB332